MWPGAARCLGVHLGNLLFEGLLRPFGFCCWLLTWATTVPLFCGAALTMACFCLVGGYCCPEGQMLSFHCRLSAVHSRRLMAVCALCSTECLIRGALSFLSSLQRSPVGSSARTEPGACPALLCCPPAHVAAVSLLCSHIEVLHGSELRWFSPSQRRNVFLETEEPPYFLLLQLASFCWPTQSRFAFSSSFCSWPQSLASFLLCACAHSCSCTIIPTFPPCQ